MPVGLPSERWDAVTTPRGPPLRCVAAMGSYQGASTPASQIQPASSLPYGSACFLAGSPCLRSLSLVGAGVGEQSKHTLDTTRRVWAGNAEPPAAARTPAFYQGPILPQMSRSDARKSELLNFSPQPLGSPPPPGPVSPRSCALGLCALPPVPGAPYLPPWLDPRGCTQAALLRVSSLGPPHSVDGAGLGFLVPAARQVNN